MDESVGGTAEPQLEQMSKARIRRVAATSATKSGSDFYLAWNKNTQRVKFAEFPFSDSRE
jgi:hypothetical protein